MDIIRTQDVVQNKMCYKIMIHETIWLLYYICIGILYC